jgi:protein phosphatase
MQNPFEPAQSPVAREMTVRLGAQTDVGQLREHNEDNFLVCANLAEGNWFLVETPYALSEAGTLLAVADGMGGENAGEVASALAVEAIKSFFGPARRPGCHRRAGHRVDPAGHPVCARAHRGAQPPQPRL